MQLSRYMGLSSLRDPEDDTDGSATVISFASLTLDTFVSFFFSSANFFAIDLRMKTSISLSLAP